MSNALKTRFLSKAIPQGDCLVWTGGKSKTSGYGLFWLDGKNQSAHRVSYRLHHGAIPAGMLIMHTCDNRLCVNPDHLKPGTYADNMVDKESKGRGNHVRGQSHPKSALTTAIAEQIRARFVPYDRKNGSCALAREFGVSQSAVHTLLRGETWKP